jgi:hypothetical protein
MFEQERNPWETLGLNSEKPPFPPDYQPRQWEWFDHQGLLILQVANKVAWYRPEVTEACQYLAIYCDGELGLLISGNTVILNRFQNLALVHQLYQAMEV